MDGERTARDRHTLAHFGKGHFGPRDALGGVGAFHGQPPPSYDHDRYAAGRFYRLRNEIALVIRVR